MYAFLALCIVLTVGAVFICDNKNKGRMKHTMTEKEFINSLNEEVIVISKAEYDKLKGGEGNG